MYNVLHISVNVLIFFRLLCETAIVSYVSAKKNSTEDIRNNRCRIFFHGKLARTDPLAHARSLSTKMCSRSKM